MFDGRNFAIWSSRVKSTLIAKGFTLRPKPGDAKPEDVRRYDEAGPVARAILINSLSDSQLMLVMACNSSYEIWGRLKSLHGQPTPANKLILQQQFYGLKQGEESAQDFIACADYLFGQLPAVGANISEASLVDRIVCGLTRKVHISPIGF